jgi:hypothetical protein
MANATQNLESLNFGEHALNVIIPTDPSLVRINYGLNVIDFDFFPVEFAAAIFAAVNDPQSPGFGIDGLAGLSLL